MKTSNNPVLLLVLVLLIPILSACAGALAKDPVARVEAYQKAHNAGDVDAIMEMFAPNATFELVGQGTLPDLEAIRAIHSYDRGIESQLTFHDCEAVDQIVTCRAEETNRWLSTAGIDKISYSSTVFTFNEEGEIERIQAMTTEEDGAAMATVLADFVPWLMRARPGEASDLFSPDGAFVYSEANGELVVDLLAAWQAQR